MHYISNLQGVGSLMQAAYAQRRLVIRHATKISKRLAHDTNSKS